MLNISNTQRVIIWDIEDKGTYALVRMGSSRKEKGSDTYKNSNWSFVRFVGQAYAKIADLSERDRIVLKGAGISLEPYNDKEGNRQYPKNPQIVVFNWEPLVYEQSDGTPPVVQESDDDDLPF